jgi:hypothetical protein
MNFVDVAAVKARFHADYRADNPSGIPSACSD